MGYNTRNHKRRPIFRTFLNRHGMCGTGHEYEKIDGVNVPKAELARFDHYSQSGKEDAINKHRTTGIAMMASSICVFVTFFASFRLVQTTATALVLALCISMGLLFPGIHYWRMHAALKSRMQNPPLSTDELSTDEPAFYPMA